MTLCSSLVEYNPLVKGEEQVETPTRTVTVETTPFGDVVRLVPDSRRRICRALQAMDGFGILFLPLDAR